MRVGMLDLHDTSILVWEDDVDEKAMHKAVYGPLIRVLRTRGFSIHRDPETIKHYRCLSWNHHYGRKGDLEVSVELSGRCLKVEFFQNLNFENSNGGRYDFDKFQKMPYLMQKRFILEASAILHHLHYCHGYQYGKRIEGYSPCYIIKALCGIDRVKEPLKGFDEQWGADRFRRDETGWPEASQYDYGYNKDREGVHLRNGMVRWCRGRDGRLKRGTIYTNMNEMWQIIYGPGRKDTTWVSCRELFSLQSSDCRGRFFDASYRKSRIEKALSKALKEMRYERAAILRDVIHGSREAAVASAA